MDSVSKIKLKILIDNIHEIKSDLYKHLSPITVNTIITNLPETITTNIGDMDISPLPPLEENIWYTPFTNEDKEPSYVFNKWNLVTIKDIKAGEELTLTYTFYKL